MIRDRRRSALAATALVALALMTACTPEPAPSPSPSPTGFASEDEAFAAAEATYRAYVDAGNADRRDPGPTPKADSFLTGKALTDSVLGEQRLADAGVRLVGDTQLISVGGDSWSRGEATVIVCLDLRDVRLVDGSGVDVTPPSRADTGSLSVDVVFADPIPLIAASRVGDATC